MSIKNVVLKTGEQLICDLKEGYYERTDKDGNVKQEKVCYQLENPCLVVVNDPTIAGDVDDEGNPSRLSVFLYPWPQLSAETSVKIALNEILTMVEPTEELKTLYTTKVLNKNEGREEGTESDHDDSAD